MMNKTDLQTLKSLISGTEKIKVVNFCDGHRTVYEGMVKDAPSENWEKLEVFGIQTKDGYLLIDVC